MLVNDQEQFVRTHFQDEAEIERLVQQFAEQIFGPSSLYLPQARIATLGGRGTVPDAVVIDIQREEWYIVEAERAVHGTWEHIAPQVSRQLAAVAASTSREVLLNLALDLLRQNPELKQIFAELDIPEIEIHGRLQRILGKPPTVAIPIDGIPKDLTEWAQTLRNTVKIWVLEKYVAMGEGSRVLYSIPDESLPTLSTEHTASGDVATVRGSGNQLWRELLEAMPDLLGKPLLLEYGPRGGQKQTFRGVIREDGVAMDGEVHSPSYAAVLCIRATGSQRRTANGWVMWKLETGEFLTDLYNRIRSGTSSLSEDQDMAE